MNRRREEVYASAQILVDMEEDRLQTHNMSGYVHALRYLA